MPRYIDAEEAIEVLQSLGSRDYRREKGTICDAIKMLSSEEYIQTADVKEVKHRKWVIIEEDTFFGLVKVKCDCGESMWVQPSQTMPKYCHGCGAKMDSEKE